MAVFYSGIVFATLLMAATSFLITEEDPILPVQQLLNDDTLLRILPNDKKEIVQCLDGTYLDKSTLTCKFENLRPPQVLVGISPQVRPHSAHPHPDMCPSGRIGDFENPENCRSFVSCGASGAYLVHCAENLLYNEVLNQCDWPKESVCCEFKEKTPAGYYRTPSRKQISMQTKYITTLKSSLFYV